MARRPTGDSGSEGTVPVFGAILSDSVRRDLADLNLRFLELGLEGGADDESLVGWSGPVRGAIHGADPSVLRRMSACPFAFFEVNLAGAGSGTGEAAGVEDSLRPHGDGTAAGALAAFRRVALFTAWRLADSAPLAARIAFGLGPGAELQLNEMCPSEVAWLAGQPGVIRARWPRDVHFWALLREAARTGCPHSLQWAHCFGICLMDGDRGGASADDVVTARPAPRR